MKPTEGHHLNDNELAMALGQAQHWAGSNSSTLLAAIAAVVIVAGGVLGYMAFTNNTDNKAGAIEVLRKRIKNLSEQDAGRRYDRLVGPGGLNKTAALNTKGGETVLELRRVLGGGWRRAVTAAVKTAPG